MTRNLSVLFVNKKCRICLSDEGSMIDIFTAELSPKIRELAKSTSIHINDEENLPRKICHICLYKLGMWCDFKKQFIRTNMLLQRSKNITVDHAGSATKRGHDDTEEYFDKNIKDRKRLKSNDETLVKPIQSVDNGKSTAKPIMSSTVDLDDDDTCNMLTPPIGETSKFELDTTSGSGDECHIKLSPMTKTRSFTGRRTSEQRMASTQRWVARKKALLAATGGNDSDTDSMGSDNMQLSPIQQARSKNQQVEKEVETVQCSNKSVNNSGAYDDEHNKIDPGIKPNDNNTINGDEIKEPFQTHTIQSELIIGDATFIVTSKLLLSEPQCSNQSLINISEISVMDNATAAIANNQQQNTDIIDAVELRRVNRSSTKNLIERCLNIEVEGTDLSALQRIQIELDNYLMTDMKNKFLNSVTSASETMKVENNKLSQQTPQDSFQTLEQKLKTIVEKAIKKNLEMTKMRRVPISKIATSNNRCNKIFSAAFIKAAMKSQIFQPKVLLNRIQPIIEQPCKPEMNDNISLNDSHSEVTCVNDIVTKNEIIDCYEVDETINNIVNTTIVVDDNDIKINCISEKKRNLDGGHYSCSICNELFATKIDIERHLSSHKNSKNTKTPINIISKRKMMRCKRCHEIVESRYVKTHVCEWKKSLYRCSTCDVSFKNEYFLLRHLKVHEKVAIEEIAVAVAETEVKEVREETAMMDEVKIERVENISQINVSRVIDVDEKNWCKKNILKPSNNIITYTCFVCDKNFTDEELLKDHLQQHCDDVSDDDDNRNNVKKQLYQCAICGETLDNETTLGYHVEKHLFEENTIDDKNSINSQRDEAFIKFNDELKGKFNLHTCVQCNEQFENEINLALHVQGHDEESAIAEWEKHGFIKTTQVYADHTCTICDDTFDSEAALAHHIDIHNESSHICLLCDKPFLTLAELQSHVNTH